MGGIVHVMILCVTLNPCLDKTLTVPPWAPGDSVRGREVREVVGGKGNNVARALARLGRAGVRPMTLLGGDVGDRCRRLLRESDGLDPIVVWCEAATRVILTVRTEGTSAQTAFFDPDPAVTESEARALVDQVETALAESTVEALVLAGSSPSPATHSVYADLIGLARARRVPVFLDTYGEALAEVWGFWPDVLQLNRREAAGYLGKAAVSDADVVGLLERWGRRGVACGVVTDGPRAVLARAGGRILRVMPPAVEAVNPIGSGDCLLAGLVDGWLKGRDPASRLRRDVACAVANALTWDAGAIDPADVETIEAGVGIEHLP